jgi:hypothetical protein
VCKVSAARAEQCLAIFNRYKDEFFRRYIVMDETWLLHYTPESNPHSAEWTERDEPNPKCGKTHRSAGKVMVSVFWDARGIIFNVYLEKGQIINKEYYIELLDPLNDEIKAPFEEENVLFHQQCTVSQINQSDGKIA